MGELFFFALITGMAAAMSETQFFRRGFGALMLIAALALLGLTIRGAL